MIVFIGNLPPVFLNSHLGDLARIASGTHHRIIKKQNIHGGACRYGLIYLKSERDAQQLISSLNGFVSQGCTLEVREYQCRAACNERRRLDWRTLPRDGVERRRSERRAPGSAIAESVTRR
jgi:hypothetical protein